MIPKEKVAYGFLIYTAELFFWVAKSIPTVLLSR